MRRGREAKSTEGSWLPAQVTSKRQGDVYLSAKTGVWDDKNGLDELISGEVALSLQREAQEEVPGSEQGWAANGVGKSGAGGSWIFFYPSNEASWSECRRL